MPLDGNSAWHIQMLGSGGEEDIYLKLKYYADEVEHQHWHKDFLDDVIPEHEDLPYDRDCLLPKRIIRHPLTASPPEVISELGFG